MSIESETLAMLKQLDKTLSGLAKTLGGNDNSGGVGGSRRQQTQKSVQDNQQRQAKVPSFDKLSKTLSTFKTVVDQTERLIGRKFIPKIDSASDRLDNLSTNLKDANKNFKDLNNRTGIVEDSFEALETQVDSAGVSVKRTRKEFDEATESVKAISKSLDGAVESSGSLKSASYKTSIGLRHLSGAIGKSVGQLIATSASLNKTDISSSTQLLENAIQQASATIANQGISTSTISKLDTQTNAVANIVEHQLRPAVTDLSGHARAIKTELSSLLTTLQNSNGSMAGLVASAPGMITAGQGINILAGSISRRNGLQTQFTRMRDRLVEVNRHLNRMSNAIGRGNSGGGFGGAGGGGGGRGRGGRGSGGSGAGSGSGSGAPAAGFKGIIGSVLDAFKGVSDRLQSNIFTNVVAVVDQAFQTLAARGLGVSTNFLSLSTASVLAGMSLRDMAIVMDENNGLLSRSESIEGFTKRLADGRDALAKFGIFGIEATRMTAAMAGSAQTLGVPLADLAKATNGQISVFEELRKTTTMTAEQMTDLIRSLQSSEIVQKELLGLSKAERATRMAQLTQTAAWGRSLGLTSDEADRLTQALLAQRRTTVKQRFQQRGRLGQAMGIAGMGSDQIARAQQLASIRNRSVQEEQEYTRLLGEYAQRSEQLRQSGNPGMQFQIEAMDEKLGEVGLSEMIDAAGRVRAAEESGPQQNKDLGRMLGPVGIAVGKAVTVLEGLAQSPIFQAAGGAALLAGIAFIASPMYLAKQAAMIGAVIKSLSLPGAGPGGSGPDGGRGRGRGRGRGGSGSGGSGSGGSGSGGSGSGGSGSGGKIGRVVRSPALRMAGGLGMAAAGAGMLGSAVMSGMDAEERLKEDQSNTEAKEDLRTSHFEAGGTVIGTAIGGVIGSVVPGLGTAFGMAVGSAAGGLLGKFFSGFGKESRQLAAETQKNTRELMNARRATATPTTMSAGNLGGMAAMLQRDTRAYTAPTAEEVEKHRQSKLSDEEKKKEAEERELATKNTRQGRAARDRIRNRERIQQETVLAETEPPTAASVTEPVMSELGRRSRMSRRERKAEEQAERDLLRVRKSEPEVTELPAPPVEAPTVEPIPIPTVTVAEPAQTKPVEPVQARPVEPVQTKPVEPVQARPVEPVQARPEPTKPVQAKPVEPVQTKPVEPIQARPEPTKPVQAKPIEPSVQAKPTALVEPPIETVQAKPASSNIQRPLDTISVANVSKDLQNLPKQEIANLQKTMTGDKIGFFNSTKNAITDSANQNSLQGIKSQDELKKLAGAQTEGTNQGFIDRAIAFVKSTFSADSITSSPSQKALSSVGTLGAGALAIPQRQEQKSVTVPNVNSVTEPTQQSTQQTTSTTPPEALAQSDVMTQMLAELKRSNDYEQQSLDIQTQLLQKTGARRMIPNQHLANRVLAQT